jgi:hypothetical protein
MKPTTAPVLCGGGLLRCDFALIAQPIWDAVTSLPPAWVPSDPAQRYPNDGDQHHGEDVRAFFEEAMRDYADVPAVRAALDAYARDELPAWLED